MLVEGVLQGVGYRAIVKQAARFLGVKGLVRNLDDGRVEIFCEGSKTSLEKFQKLIDIRGKPEDILSINVTKIEFVEEGEKGYSPAWKLYRGFEIDYGVEKLSPFEESSLEDHEFGKLYFSSFRNELKSFREDANVSFAQMAEKYGDISAELKEFRTGIERFMTKFLKEYSKKRM
jgi:acylphosphatase